MTRLPQNFDCNTYMIEELGTGNNRIGNLRSKEDVKRAIKENDANDTIWGVYYRNWAGSEHLEAVYAEERWFNG